MPANSAMSLPFTSTHLPLRRYGCVASSHPRTSPHRTVTRHDLSGIYERRPAPLVTSRGRDASGALYAASLSRFSIYGDKGRRRRFQSGGGSGLRVGSHPAIWMYSSLRGSFA